MSPNTARNAKVDKCGIWSANETDPSRCHQSNKMTEYSLEYNLTQIEELIWCGHCKKPFDDSTHLPKDLACKHTFCLECIQSGLGKASVSKGSTIKSGELYCELCWKLTELTEKGPQTLETNGPKLALVKLYMKLKGENYILNGDSSNINTELNEQRPDETCIAHGSPLRLWCIDCEKLLCVECQKTIHADSKRHRIWTREQAKDQMKKEAFAELVCMSHLDDNVRQLAKRQRQFLVLIRDACTALMREVQSSLDGDWNVDPTAEVREALTPIQLALMDAKTPKEVHELYSVVLLKKQTLQAKCQEMIIQCQLNDLIGNSDVIFDFDSLRQAVARILSSENNVKPIPLQQPVQDPIMFLTNYCMSQLFTRLHQRASGDSAMLNHSMQRQLVINSADPPVNSFASSMPSPPQNLAIGEPAETFINANDSEVHQVEYPEHQSIQPQVSVPFDTRTDAEISRAPTPLDTFSSPPTPQNAFDSSTATTAQIVQMQSTVPVDQPEPPAPIIHPPTRPVPIRSPANVSPRYFFNISINGTAKGHIIIETRPDVAPKMCRNFDRLTTAERKMSYKGCAFFQCWKNESVITGDFECNTGRGGRSIYEDLYFQPDDTKLPAVRGAVGMRRQQKKHDHFGAVGSQFRIILQDTQNFTGIFGHVIEGIEVVDLIASYGDQTGKPIKPITITRCGKL